MNKNLHFNKKMHFFYLTLLMLLFSNLSWGQISENFSTWTSKGAYTGVLSQAGSGGTWTAVTGAAIVSPTGVANGTGSAGFVQIASASNFALTLPNIASGGVGKITIQPRASSASNASFSVDKNVNGGGFNGNII